MDTNAIGGQIRKYRKLRGWSQEELANNSDLSTMSIRRYENGDRIAPQSALIKIAKALKVHLRDLADTSMWDEFDRQHPDAIKAIREYLEFVSFLEKAGYSYHQKLVKWHWEDEKEPDPSKRVQIPDEWEITLSKEGHEAKFTQSEFEELQTVAKEAIEGKFYKKVTEQQK